MCRSPSHSAPSASAFWQSSICCSHLARVPFEDPQRNDPATTEASRTLSERIRQNCLCIRSTYLIAMHTSIETSNQNWSSCMEYLGRVSGGVRRDEELGRGERTQSCSVSHIYDRAAALFCRTYWLTIVPRFLRLWIGKLETSLYR